MWFAISRARAAPGRSCRRSALGSCSWRGSTRPPRPSASARARVTQTLASFQSLTVAGAPGAPAAQVHRDVDRHEKRQIADDPNDRDGEDHAKPTIELRQQPAKADADNEEGKGPDRIFD